MSVEKIYSSSRWKAALLFILSFTGYLNIISSQGPPVSTNYRFPKTEFRQDGLDLTLNEITFLHAVHPELTGENMNICIKENLFDTADIDFKNRIGSLEFAASYMDMHATNMATIAAGGGNSAPSAKGVAWNAVISSASFANLLPEPEAYFINNSISVQTHAYGTGIENFYGNESKAYDEIAYKLPWLIHVFSSGNEGESAATDGQYAGLAGWANLTGQFKQSKNTITAGAVDSFNNVVTLSSRGPAFDGRIKPEIVAYGHGGSSGAAAIVGGTSLLLQEMYLILYGQLPPSSLIKAVLINSVRDVGPRGPDYISGFGSVKAGDAVRSIVENRFFIDALAEEEQIEIPIFLPSQITEANFTLVWTDPPSNVDVETSLVNDIDFNVEDEQGNTWLPWILNSNPHHDSLLHNAKRGIDTINNVEKITIDSPEPGNYRIKIKGSRIAVGPQEFSIVWDFKSRGEFQWTFPTRHDHLLPDSTNVIRWNTSASEVAVIEYRLIGGDWTTVATINDSSKEYYAWRPPSIDGLAQLRWSSSLGTFTSDTFVIASPLKPDVALWCVDSLIINWIGSGSNDTTEIFKLGNKYMEHYAYASDTFFTEYGPDLLDKYYAIAPVYNGIRGPLSYTIDFTQQGGGCYLNLFYELYVLNGIASFSAALSRINEISQVVLEQKVNGVFIPILFIDEVDSSRLFFQSGQLTQGINEFRLVVQLKSGEEIYSDVVSVFYVREQELLLFPNPALSGEEVTLLHHSIDDFEVRIFDMQGREILTVDLNSSPLQIPTFKLHAGIYIVYLVSETGQARTGLIQVIDGPR